MANDVVVTKHTKREICFGMPDRLFRCVGLVLRLFFVEKSPVGAL